MELNREQIVKALECCYMQELGHNENCQECPYTAKYVHCAEQLGKDALALIRERTEENERLTAQVEQSEITIKDLRSRNHELTRANMSLSKYADELQLELAECVQIKADTVRKMQERVNQVFGNAGVTGGLLCQVFDQIAKEMLEEA